MDKNRINDAEFIKNIFDNDGVKAPDTLSEESMLAKIEPKRMRPVFKRAIAAAAVFVLACFGIGGLYSYMHTAPDTELKDGELYTFKSEDEIKRIIRGMEQSSPMDYFGLKKSAPGDIVYETEDAAASGDAGVGADSSHSSTYLQVEDVDEADIIKTDGKYIYYVNDKKEVYMYSASGGKAEKIGVIGSNGIENYIDDIFLKNDKLITVGVYYKDDEEFTGIAIYDISDRSNPKLVDDFSQSGHILSSRMVGDYVYLVTNEYIFDDNHIRPICGFSENRSEIDVSDICCMPDPQTKSFIVLSAIDTASGKQKKSRSKAVFGAGSEIYCNNSNLYVSAGVWDSKKDSQNTVIAKAELDGVNVKFTKTAEVNGYLNDQFSMDERDGYFRVATTSQRAGVDVNNLYVFDETMKETGKLSGFARNESIKAVRFLGSKAYVITYEAIDPLFVIDLADTANPKIDGEVKIDGFSTLLVPIKEGRLLGIGHATGDNGYGGEYDSGFKLVIFDVSNPSKPAVLDSKEFENMSSPSQYDHHALMVNKDKDYYAVPYNIYEDFEDDVVIDAEIAEDAEPKESAGVLAFEASDDKINVLEQKQLSDNTLCRNVYIGDYIYAFDEEGGVYGMKSPK